MPHNFGKMLLLFFLWYKLSEYFRNIELWNVKIGYEQQSRYGGQSVIDYSYYVVRQKQSGNIENRENNCRGGYGKPTVSLGTAVFAHLALCFKHVEKRKANNCAKHVENEQGNAAHGVHTAEIQDNGREHTKADDVAERVKLDSEILFVRGSVFLGARDNAVKHIAKSRKRQATYCPTESAVICELHSYHRGY